MFPTVPTACRSQGSAEITWNVGGVSLFLVQPTHNGSRTRIQIRFFGIMVSLPLLLEPHIDAPSNLLSHGDANFFCDLFELFYLILPKRNCCSLLVLLLVCSLCSFSRHVCPSV